MKTLILMRHAKAETVSLRGGDHDRALSQKGIKRTHLIGTYLQDRNISPDAILTSSSQRTTETVDRLLPFFAGRDDPPVTNSRALYLADPDRILSEIWTTEDDVETLLAVGHNPGFHELASQLAKSQSGEVFAKLQSNFPTGALAILHFDAASWTEIDARGGQLEDVVFPSDLA